MKDSKNTSEKTVNVLWTGGFDSTFRILQLSIFPIKIQSYYLSDNRASEEQELVSIIRNMSLIRNRAETKCTFAPLVIIDKKNRKNYPDIEQAYARLKGNIMNYTWFCHTPINNKPCGICNPCHFTIEEGMSERFSKMALFRHKYRRFFLFKQKAEKYLNRRIQKIFL